METKNRNENFEIKEDILIYTFVGFRWDRYVDQNVSTTGEEKCWL